MKESTDESSQSVGHKNKRSPDGDTNDGDGSEPAAKKRAVQEEEVIVVEDNDSGGHSNEAAFIPPVAPTLDPCAGPSNGSSNSKEKWVIYLAIQEPVDGSFQKSIQECNSIGSTVSSQFQGCLQLDGTRHITIWEGKLTKNEAFKIELSGENILPIPVTFSGYKPWNAGIYLDVDGPTQTRLKSIFRNLRGPQLVGKPKCDHLSLYRRRGMNSKQFKQGCESIREKISGKDWGQVQGASVRLKVVGSDYSHCRVLAGI